MASHVMTRAERMCLHGAARDLHSDFLAASSARRQSSRSYLTVTPNWRQPGLSSSGWLAGQKPSPGSGYRLSLTHGVTP